MSWFKEKRIFLDYASATPVIPEVKEAMDKYWSKDFYNPSAIYEEGVILKRELESWRENVARIFGAAKGGVIFTNGGTQANTWAIQGLKNGHIIIDAESHPSVFDAAKNLEVSTWLHGVSIPVKKNTVLVSSPTRENKIGRYLRDLRKKNNSKYPLLHVDASQTSQYFNVGLETLSCDLITLDSSKLYGPKGVGALIVRKGIDLNLPPQGTLPVSLIAGFVKALELAVKERESEKNRLNILRSVFVTAISEVRPSMMIKEEEPNIIHILIPGILPEFLALALEKEGVLVSVGPACTSDKPEPPHTPVRFSLGRYTTKSEIEKAAAIFCKVTKSMVK